MIAIAVLVSLVLRIACANVANLMTAQSAARAREMAMRVSIGAGRWRLVQLVLVESAWLAMLSALLGACFSWWAAPFVIGRLGPPNNPVRLALPADWRVFGFGLALTAAVTLLFGLAPALRASAVKPAAAMKDGIAPRARHRLMNILIGVQVTFCLVVLFAAGLFSSTLQHLSNRPLGFAPDRILTIHTVARHAVAPSIWGEAADRLRALPGVESAAAGRFPLLGGDAWNGFISVNGGPLVSVLAYFDAVSPGWRDLMRIPLIAGRDFRAEDTSPGVAIVNETFVRTFLSNINPLGQSFGKGSMSMPFRIVSVVRDVPYRSIHEPTLPIVFVPFLEIDSQGRPAPAREATFSVRTHASDPMTMASAIRRAVPRARPELRVSNIVSQTDLVRVQTIRERYSPHSRSFLPALLSCWVVLGFTECSTTRYFSRREIGIRMAIGAPAASVVRGVAAGALLMVGAGVLAGITLGLTMVRYIASLLYEVNSGDPLMLCRCWPFAPPPCWLPPPPPFVRSVSTRR